MELPVQMVKILKHTIMAVLKKMDHTPMVHTKSPTVLNLR
jgi:hypothetical protein